jgi:DNA-binding NarL/FixJ family response regulator
MMKNQITVILADDHQNILKGISTLLHRVQNIELVGTAENGKEAVALAQTVHPDVLILDIDMPVMNGLQATARIRSLAEDIKIVIFSIYDDPSIVRAAIKQGASGYVLKNRTSTDLVQAVQAAAAGEVFVSAPVAEYAEGLEP